MIEFIESLWYTFVKFHKIKGNASFSTKKFLSKITLQEEFPVTPRGIEPLKKLSNPHRKGG